MAVQPTRTIDFDRANEVVQRFQKESTKWLYGLDDAARILSWAFFTLLPYTDKLSQSKLLRQPHVMFRGPTGTGKTDLVSACAMAIDAKFERIQGLPTYMPEDILGYETIVEQKDGSRKLVFKPGKLMAHIVLIDEDWDCSVTLRIFMADEAALSVEVYAMAHLTLSFLFSGLGRRSGSAAVDGLESDDPSGCPP